MSQSKAQSIDPLEPGAHTFTGVVKTWQRDYGELLMDSGVTITLLTYGHPPMTEGTRITITARRLRPLFQIETLSRVP
jgi:hypothetical protein